MKGAHSIRKRGTRRTAVFAAVVLLVVAVAGTAASAYATGQNPLGILSFAQGEPATSAESDSVHGEAASYAHKAGNLVPDTSSDELVDASHAACESYENARYGFAVETPEGFAIEAELPDGEGAVLFNDALDMTVCVFGKNNAEGLDADALLASLWNGSEDSIARVEGDCVIIYQHDEEHEYFYWVNVGSGSFNQMEIRYPLREDNHAELDAAQALMQGFKAGDLGIAH